MRVGIIGGGTIARLALDHVRRGQLGKTRVVALLGRNEASPGKQLARRYRVRFVTSLEALLALEPDVVVEAASHEAVREHGAAVLGAGVDLIVLSAGALCDDALRARLERAARRSGALLYVPSGGIGGLDALKAARLAGVQEVRIAVAKPPAAWKGVAHVERLGVDLGSLREPLTLYEGPARKGVALFPANVNIAAVLSLAGVGFERTRLKVVADPALRFNTHLISIRARTGTISVKLENVPAPENPKTAWLACYSALAALAAARSPVRYGT
ncbi:MAG TPA: aspartate dehydrogenase [Burkholderiales bacterium]|nr:aspartate dehydrogenase [Burkholderiales bacterium]